MSRAVSRVVLVAVAVVCLAAGVAFTQSTSTSTEAKSFEVIAVDGNRLVVKLPEGTRELTVPDDFRFTVNGQPMSVHELKPGMAGTATITTRTTVTPVTVTEVKNGTVYQKSGANIIVRTDEGFKMFTQGAADKRGVRIVRDGQPVSIADLNTGDQLTATIVTSKPPKVMTEKEVQLKTRPAAKTTAAAAHAAPAPAAAGASEPAAAPKSLPKTASPLPLLGLAGLASLLSGMGLTALRRVR